MYNSFHFVPLCIQGECSNVAARRESASAGSRLASDLNRPGRQSAAAGSLSAVAARVHSRARIRSSQVHSLPSTQESLCLSTHFSLRMAVCYVFVAIYVDNLLLTHF